MRRWFLVAEEWMNAHRSTLARRDALLLSLKLVDAERLSDEMWKELEEVSLAHIDVDDEELDALIEEANPRARTLLGKTHLSSEETVALAGELSKSNREPVWRIVAATSAHPGVVLVQLDS